MSSPPGRRIAPQPQEPEGSQPTSAGRRVAGRRASEPTTGTIPVIKAPLLGEDEPAGRRIRPAAPVSAAGDTDDRRVVRSFDHTGEIPAVEFTLPPPEHPRRSSPATGSVPLPDLSQLAEFDDLSGPAAVPDPPRTGRTPLFQDEVPAASGVPENTVDLPPLWAPTTPPVPSVPVVGDAVDLIAGLEDAKAAEAAEAESEATGTPVAPRRSSWGRRAEARAAKRAAQEEPLDALAAAAPSEVPSPSEVNSPVEAPLAKPVPSESTPTGSTPTVSSDPTAPTLLPVSKPSSPSTKRLLFGWSSVLVVGMVLLALAALHVGPGWLDGIGAVAVLTTFCWALAGRTGGRQVVFSLLGFGIGTAAVVSDSPVLRSGAAMMTCVVAAVLAVVLTVPAKNFLIAVREVVVAIAVASIGAFAVIGFEPVASTSRFEILALCIGMTAMVVLVWRFAAGLHGLGTRGLVIVVVGTVLLTASQLYTELLRAYGDSAMVQPTGGLGDWLRATFGAAPRTTMVFLGVPALVWGVHMRARRRQGWWVCTFGAAATLPVAQRLVNLETSYVEAGLQTFYSVALGCLIGWVLIRLDLRFTGTRGARARADEEGGAVRPEPSRFASL